MSWKLQIGGLQGSMELDVGKGGKWMPWSCAEVCSAVNYGHCEPKLKGETDSVEC